MKRLFLIPLFLIALVSTTWAASAGFMGSGMAPGASGCDNCSGDLKLAWHAENVSVAAGSPCGCSDGDSEASEGGDSGVELSETQKSDGSYSIHVSGAQDYYELDLSGTDIIDYNNLKITFDVYLVSIAENANVHIFQVGSEATTMYIEFQEAVNRIRLIHDGSSSTAKYVYLTPSVGSWVSYEGYLKTGVDGNDMKLKIDGFEDELDGDLTDITSSPTKLYIGNNTDSVGEYYLDNIKIYGTSGY